MRAGLSRLTICAVAAVLAGCGGSNKPSAPAADATPAAKVVQPGAPGQPSREVIATPTPAGGGFLPQDVEFMQGMIHHHQQAITMTDWVADRTQSTSVRLMSRRMNVSQTDEMELMRKWLSARGVDPADHTHAHKLMPGMINSRQFAKLKKARGKTFDRLFLTYMTQHHRGALQMVQELVDDGGGAEQELNVFMLHVDADQSIEIQRMQELLAEL